MNPSNPNPGYLGTCEGNSGRSQAMPNISERKESHIDT